MSSVSRSVGRPVTRSVLAGQLNNLTQLIKSLFSLGEQGFAYDPNDLSTMYQDAAGTIPVTAAGQPVGLMLDKSGNNNHAYQTVSASRPILRQTPILGNELLVNGDFSNGLTSWSYTDANVTNGVLNVVSTGTAWRHAYQNVNVTVGKTYLLSLNVLKSGTDNCYVTYGPLSNESALNANIAQSTALQYKSYIFTATEATHRIRVQNGSATVGFTVSADNISVREVTGYRTDQNYLEFDGVDDFLQTNNINFTATDKVSLFAGVRKLSDASQGIVVELGPAVYNTIGSFAIATPSTSNGQNFYFGSSGTVFSAFASQSNNPAPISAMISCSASISDANINMKVNKISSTSRNSHGTGNYGNYPLYVGRRGGTISPFTGHLYSLIGIGRLSTDSETIALEKAIAKNVGVTLNV